MKIRNLKLKYRFMLGNTAILIFVIAVCAMSYFQNKNLLIMLFIVILLSITITYLLIYSIQKPLKLLNIATTEYKNGNYNARCNYLYNNEFGNLAMTFNQMADSMQNEIFTKEFSAKIATETLESDDLKNFCEKLLKTLIVVTESQNGAIFFNRDNELYFLYEFIGLINTVPINISAQNYTGELSEAIIKKEIRITTQIPDNTIFLSPSANGLIKPKEIITIPILEKNEIIAIISLSSIKTYSQKIVQLLHSILPILSSRMNSVLILKQILDISNLVNSQYIELEKQSAVLSRQADELKEYNRELELQKIHLNEANRLKSSFLSNISHELRTPLNSVIALSGVLLKKSPNIETDEHKYLSIIEKNGRHLLNLINDILDFSRVDAGKERIYHSTFSIHNLINAIIQIVELQAQEKNIAIENTIPEKFPEIVSDSAKCHHIFQNIIANALKFTERGSIRIDAKLVNNLVHVAITDTGIGIAEENMLIIFDEFRQLDDNSARKYEGTGLGLAIANKYALMLNGKIEVESILGSGSTFTVILPVKPIYEIEVTPLVTQSNKT